MENNKWKVSILMPVYNGEKTVKLALNSLLKQTYTNWVCIIVNDGSTDSTKAILDSLTDSRFKVIHLPRNVGRGAARQIALDNAEGDFLAYLDADDFYHETKLQKQVKELSNNLDLDLIACACGSYDDKKTLISVRGDKLLKPITHSLGDSIMFFPPSVMLKCKHARQVRYKQLNAGEDMDYFNRLLVDCKYRNIPEVLYYYSEFDSVTYSKLLEYGSIEYVNSFKQSKRDLKKMLKNIFKAHIRMVYYVIVPLFMGTNYIVEKRGRKATDEERNEFKKTLAIL